MTLWRRTVGTFAPFYQTHSESETHSSALTQQGCMNESTIMLMGRLRASRITTRMAKDQESKRKGKASGGGCHLEIDVFALSLCSNRWRIWHRGQMRTCSGLMAERPSEAMETHWKIDGHYLRGGRGSRCTACCDLYYRDLTGIAWSFSCARDRKLNREY